MKGILVEGLDRVSVASIPRMINARKSGEPSTSVALDHGILAVKKNYHA